MALEVTLIDYARDPLEKLYGAYRTCYTSKTPREVWEEIRPQPVKVEKGERYEIPFYDAEASLEKREKIREFVKERLKTGHVSPLEQVVFWFGISGVSRALSHQFVRHRIGISFEQQSQRYVKYKDNEAEGMLDFVYPPTIMRSPNAKAEYETILHDISKSYKKLCELGIPNEDARFVLPNAMPTNFQVMVNYAELLHIADLRLCHRAQWEIRDMVGKMRRLVVDAVPELGRQIQPKCGSSRMGYCDESEKDYRACPLSKARPHKAALFELWKNRGFDIAELSDEDIQPEGT